MYLPLMVSPYLSVKAILLLMQYRLLPSTAHHAHSKIDC